ncbi:lysophosphatidylcholine acyltransferase isoform X2 [Chironomus tepperi]|uniref:lysophosphatidylcholine acyltransferase isoform X2 n=1 Tax=Chironomus tepperi TaxID=113505 RepID=UPI00391F1E01
MFSEEDIKLETHNGVKRSAKFKSEVIINPFLRDKNYWDKENELFDKIKTAILTVLLVPIRVVCMFILLLFAWCLAYIGIYGYTREDLKLRPLKGWRRHMKSILCQIALSMWMLCGIGVIVKGKRSGRDEARILVAAPHSSFFDAIVIFVTKMSSPIVREEDKSLGKLIDMAQPIYVNREDHNSRQLTIQDILNRVKSNDDWPQTMIFPEGTCTNRTSLIQFKCGAFYPGLPIQPVLIRYPNKIDTFTWTWSGPDVLLLIWRTLAQFHTFVEIEYLPVYVPNEEEKKDPKLYAQNVQRLMSKELNIPTSDYTFDDCKLMENAVRTKLLFAEKLSDVKRFREKIGLAQSQIEEYIVKENFKGNEDYYLEFSEFVQRLKIPADNTSYTLFKFFVSESDIGDVIDFKEYLLHALFLIKYSEPKIELLKMMFMLYGEAGRLHREPFVNNVMKHFVKVKPDQLNKLFYSLDVNNVGSITFNDFYNATKDDKNFAILYKPNRNFRQNHKDSQ